MRSILYGEYSSLQLSFNDGNGPNYMTVAEYLDSSAPGSDPEWASEEEKAKAIATNSMWMLQWYPDTPIGSYTIAASTLPALFDHLAAMRFLRG
ncbi:hypothetical protein ADT71_06765 [Novosphingobium sp. ST904]|nr:hypothetical protein ADT71_06765 [Novosphingobium sp. ST904]